MKLSVVIVNYNVKYYLTQCLHSLYSSIDTSSTEVFVVDNASTDDSFHYITTRFPQVQYILNEKNVGFSCANNQAIRKAKGEYILLLNPDTIVPKDTIPQILAFMDKQPDAGACGVKMITSDGSFLPESKRKLPSPFASFSKLAGIYKWFPKHSKLGAYYENSLGDDVVQEVEVLAGAFMMIRKSALEVSGLLDESFFMFGEDIDLSYRISQAGYKNYYLPFPILHYKGESTRQASFRHIRVFYNAMHIFWKKYNDSYFVLFRWFVHLGIFCRAWLAVLSLVLKRLFSIFIISKKNTVSFLIFACESNVQSVDLICKHYAGPNFKYEIVVMPTNCSGKESFVKMKNRESITHIVYDLTAFTYTDVINLLLACHQKGLHLGVCGADLSVIITPDNNYF